MLNLNRSLIKRHTLLLSVTLFIALFYSINYFKPTCLYNSNGSVRQFGIGYKNKTVFPIWILAIVLAILCRIVVLSLGHYF